VKREKLAEMYYQMWLIRYFEENARDLYQRDLIRGSTHMYIGEEAVAVGACAALNPDDYITSTHRGHGHCLAKGGEPRLMMAELLGRATGYCKGKGGSMHIADPELGILGANGIVGGGIGLATGAAYSADLRGSGQVVICFFGDGAINQGILMETANMAALWCLPIIYLCEWNQYAEFSPSRPFIAVQELADRAKGFGLPGVTVDGNDVLAVYETVSKAVRRARTGKGPMLVVARTYRVEGHTVGDPLTYRPKGESEPWKAPEKDPISRFHARLLRDGTFNEEELRKIQERAREEIREGVEFALQSPEPAVESLWEDVYA
jgi:TPP-dependent pyruvate/acetoin dehydrogenase alpha subunit